MVSSTFKARATREGDFIQKRNTVHSMKILGVVVAGKISQPNFFHPHLKHSLSLKLIIIQEPEIWDVGGTCLSLEIKLWELRSFILSFFNLVKIQIRQICFCHSSETFLIYTRKQFLTSKPPPKKKQQNYGRNIITDTGVAFQKWHSKPFLTTEIGRNFRFLYSWHLQFFIVLPQL